MTMEQSTVAVIGAGFSGLLTALRLLVDPNPPVVRLVERRPAFARGAAYSTLDPDHLLNVRASNMSAFPEDPEHFVRWMEAEGRAGMQNVFAPRHLYGDYLQAMIKKAVEQAPAGRLVLEPDAAVGLQQAGGRWRLEMAMGRRIEADAVVLALGNLAPTTPACFEPEAALSRAYVADPWSLDVEQAPSEGLVVIIGTGLTMIDVALALAKRRPKLQMLALSRRGMLPRRHLDAGPAPRTRPPPDGLSVAGWVRILRREAADHDWRAVLDGVRPHVHAVWGGWSIAERRRFLRHARPWWDVHRHRLAPPVASQLDHLVASGRLSTAAGRLVTVRAEGEGLEVHWRPRGGRRERLDRASLVINCAGPNGDPEQSADPLLINLLAAGRVQPDPLHLGLEVDEAGRLVGAGGVANQTLFAVGPLTRGRVWEITSVPDIRLQAARCAQSVLAILNGGAAAA